MNINTEIITEPKKIKVVARKWVDKTYGNTYHSVDIFLEKKVLHQGFTYGGEEMFKQTVVHLLKKEGIESINNIPAKYNYEFYKNFDFKVIENCKKRDLK